MEGNQTKKCKAKKPLKGNTKTTMQIVQEENGEYFVDKYGRKCKLIKRFGSEEELTRYCRENWLLMTGNNNAKSSDRLYLGCRRGTISGRNSHLSTNCPLRAIYVKSNGSLYQREEHNHLVENRDFTNFLSKHADDEKADFVDHYGQHWPFFRQIEKLGELRKFAYENMLIINSGNGMSNGNGRIYFKCKYACTGNIKRYAYPPPYCKMKAVFVKGTLSVYVLNQHSNHPPIKLKSSCKSWTKCKVIRREWTKIGKSKNEEKNAQNRKEVGEQDGQHSQVEQRKEDRNEPTPKEETKDGTDSGGEGEEEVRIVKHLQRDYKCLGRMKPEGGEQERTVWPVHTIQLDEEEKEGISRKTGTFYRYTERKLRMPIKKEEPAEVEEAVAEEALQQVPPPQLPPRIQIVMPQWLLQPQRAEVNEPTKMLLRERKRRINYGE